MQQTQPMQQTPQRAQPVRLLSYAEYARRHDVDRSTVKRWVDAGVISSKPGGIDPDVADHELEANRPIARGRAAWRDLSARLPSPLPAADWAPTPRVLAVLRAHGPLALAARLSSEKLPVAAVAVACAHLADLIDSLVSVSFRSDGDPLSDGTMPAAGMPALVGVDYPGIVAGLAASNAADVVASSEMDLFADQLAG